MNDLQRQAWIASKQAEIAQWEIYGKRAVLVGLDFQAVDAASRLGQIADELQAFAAGPGL